MNGYRFHLQKYRLGSKTVCPECGRKACFTRYIDEAGEISFPGNVGKCDHICPGQSYRQREVGRTRKGWPGKVGSEDSTGTGAKNILSSL